MKILAIDRSNEMYNQLADDTNVHFNDYEWTTCIGVGFRKFSIFFIKINLQFCNYKEK